MFNFNIDLNSLQNFLDKSKIIKFRDKINKDTFKLKDKESMASKIMSDNIPLSYSKTVREKILNKIYKNKIKKDPISEESIDIFKIINNNFREIFKDGI